MKVTPIELADGLAFAAETPRVVYHVYHEGSYLSFDGTAEVSPIAAETHGPAMDTLVGASRSVAGKEHPDWDEFREAMVCEERRVITGTPTSVVGLIRPSGAEEPSARQSVCPSMAATAACGDSLRPAPQSGSSWLQAAGFHGASSVIVHIGPLAGRAIRLLPAQRGRVGPPSRLDRRQPVHR